MSVPTSRTSRSPFRRSAFNSAAVPGAPDAVTMTVIGFTRATYRSARSARLERAPDGGQAALHRRRRADGELGG
jgi:hypothetical protein